MLFVKTHTDHTFAHANLDILEMDTTVQVQSIFCLHYLTGHTRSLSVILFSFFTFFCVTDIDECKTYPGKCHTNAICKNTHGSHVCACKPGYTGDGHNCTGTVNILPPLLNRAHKELVNHSFVLFPFFFFFFFLTNIYECKTYPCKCQVNAICNNRHQIQTWIYWRWTYLFFCCCCFLF